MKKIITTACVLATAAIALLPLGCNKSEPGAGTPSNAASKSSTSAEKTSFREVTAQLDPGGSLYCYLSTEQLLQGVGDRISNWRQLFSAIPNIGEDERAKINKVFDVVTALVKDSGIEDVTGFGASSIAREPGFYHTKMLVHHYRGKGSGFLWTMFGQKPHALDGLKLLPDTTVVAYFGDLDVPLLWSVVKKEVGKANLPEAEQALEQLPQLFENATGLEWEKVLASFGGEFGFAFMLDDSRKISLPLPGAAVEVPEPSLMLVAKVKDDTIFNRLEALMKQSGQQVESVDKPELKMRTLPLPLPLPIQLRPTIASSGGYLLIANSDAVIKEALAVKSGQGKGLQANTEFQRLSRDVPQQGNQFSFVSRRFGDTFLRLQGQAMAHMGGDSGDRKADWFQSLVGTNAAGCSCGVSANTDEGWLAIANGNQHPAKLALTAGVVPVAMLSAIAIPNFVKARQTAQKNACLNNLRQIDAAKKMWALEKKKNDADTPTRSELEQYLANKRMPVCPAGGTYTINAVSQAPECSVEGHELPK